MSDERKIQFEFNTAITGLEPGTGKWDEDKHKQQVMSLRGLIMQIDGVCGCFIGRYGMRVDYMPNVVSKTSVIRQVKAAVVLAAHNRGMFPLRGNKKPSARPEKPAVRTTPTATWWVARVVFDTDLYVRKSEEHEMEITDKLSARLANADGARETGVWQRGMYVRFDKRNVAPENMETHLRWVVESIMDVRNREDYFPFAEPNFKYETYATAYVI